MKTAHILVASLLALAGFLHAALVSPFMFDRIDHEAVWFVSGGMLGLTAGLASLAAAVSPPPRRAVGLAALAGCLGVLFMATALTQASIYLIRSPLVIAYLILSSLGALLALRTLFRG